MTKIQYLMSADAGQYLTVQEASAELGVKEPVIRNYLCDGKLTTYKFKTLTLLSRKEVEDRKEGDN